MFLVFGGLGFKSFVQWAVLMNMLESIISLDWVWAWRGNVSFWLRLRLDGGCGSKHERITLMKASIILWKGIFVGYV